MKLFEAVKEGVEAKDVALRYGLKVRKNGLTNCVFHEDEHPSMKVDRRFHCFACQADGDAIDLACRMLGLSPKQAALRLAEDFGIAYDKGYTRASRGSQASGLQKTEKAWDKPGISERLREKQEEARVIRVFLDYHRLLAEWQDAYQPRAPDEEWHPRFVEALQKRTYVEHVLDTLLSCSSEERGQLVKTYGKEADQIEERIRRIPHEREVRRTDAKTCRYAGAAER